MLSKKQFERLFDKYGKSVAQILSCYTSDRNQLEDWTQEVFLKVWEARDKIDPGNPRVKGYILRIASNHAVYELDRRNSVPLVLEDEPELFADERNNIKEDIAKKELASAYDDALEKIPPRAKEAFSLSRDEDLTYKEIATAMDISHKTVERQISKTLRILRVELKEYRV